MTHSTQGAEDAVLLPCPFCGTRNATIDGTNLLSIRCRYCHAMTGRYQDEEAAVENWNRRSPAQPTGLVEAARTAKDYAVEFGGYLADAAYTYAKVVNETYGKAEITNVVGFTELSESYRALQSAIYEFRKRRDYAAALASHPVPVSGEGELREILAEEYERDGLREFAAKIRDGYKHPDLKVALAAMSRLRSTPSMQTEKGNG